MAERSANCFHELTDEIFSSVNASTKEYANVATEVLDNLFDNLEIQKHCIANIVERLFEDILHTQRTYTAQANGVTDHNRRIYRDALDGHNSTSYIADIMRPAYNICNAESVEAATLDERTTWTSTCGIRAYSQGFLKISRRTMQL
ncbi:hypothetical protein BDW67DRAFT_76037 [Aspergillus spinulosporus]